MMFILIKDGNESVGAECFLYSFGERQYKLLEELTITKLIATREDGRVELCWSNYILICIFTYIYNVEQVQSYDVYQQYSRNN